MSSIDAALAFIERLPPTEHINITKIANQFECNRTTLSKRYRGVTGSRHTQYQNQQNLNDQQEKSLVKYIDRLCARGLPPSKHMVRNFAQEICRKEVGTEWVSRFLRRHQVELVSKWTMGLDHNRARADSAFKYTLYFELLRKKLEQYEVEPQNIYNMDEKGFLIGILSKMKRIFSRRRYEAGEIKQIIQDGNREWITTIVAICADGSVLSPGLIYQATTGLIQDSWLQDFDPNAQSCFFASSPSGWTNNELGFQWLTQIFERETKAKAQRSWRLLILDGHGSHISMKFIDYCDSHRILLAIYPPHATHTLQPLDVCLFRPLSQAYSDQLVKFMDLCQGFSSITKRDFFRLFWHTWKTSFTPENILSGFKATGLHPFDPQLVITKFTKTTEDRPSSSSSRGSAIAAEDWKRIEKLLRTVVSNIYDKKTQKLSNTMYALSLENMLLKQQNNSLKQSLINEKKRRKRGKPLLLDFPTENNGGAMFFSPTKVQRARDQQAQKDANAIAERQQKEVDKVRKEAEKAEKAQKVEERKAMRANMKEEKLRKQAEKQQKKDEAIQAKQVSQQLHSELTIRAKKVPKPIKAQKQSDAGGGIDLVVVEDADPPPPRNTHGRQIRLPKRFQPSI